MGLSDLPTLAQVEAARRGKPILKGKTRLEQTMDEKPLTRVDEKAFRAAVYQRDGSHCRCCGRKVLVTMGRIPERREIHHLHGRVGDLRFEPRAAIVACCQCHERLTGRVNAHKLIIIPTQTFTTRQGTFSDATFPIVFKEVA
jgi:hypothetical protein